MVGAAYAAVPFYNWFCRATGFNGTTQLAKVAPTAPPLQRKISVRFDSNVAGGLPWKFEPEKTEIETRPSRYGLLQRDQSGGADHDRPGGL